MTTQQLQESNHADIQHLAYLNWEKDGCQQDRAIDYWLAAEQQLKETYRLPITESAPTKQTAKNQSAVPAKSKFKPNPSVRNKISVSPNAARR
jgi:hypothetical protein